MEAEPSFEDNHISSSVESEAAADREHFEQQIRELDRLLGPIMKRALCPQDDIRFAANHPNGGFGLGMRLRWQRFRIYRMYVKELGRAVTEIYSLSFQNIDGQSKESSFQRMFADRLKTTGWLMVLRICGPFCLFDVPGVSALPLFAGARLRQTFGPVLPVFV